MARRGEIEIPIAVDTGGVEKSIRNGLIDPIEDAEQALEELGKADAGRDLERDMDRAQDATRDFEGELADAREGLKKLSYAARDVGDDAKRGFARAEDGAEEFKDEANSTAKEAAASFDGSAESIGDAFQEVAANAFAGFGPAGAVAGIAAAAGIGLAMAGFEDVGEAQERLKEQAGEWADAYREAGSKVLGSAQLVERGLSILTDRYDEVTENAKNWGVTEETAVAAMAGSAAAIQEVEASLRAKTDAAEADARAAAKVAEENGGVLLTETLMQAEVRKGTDALNFQKEAMNQGAKQADTYSYFLRDLAAKTDGATSKVDKFGDTIVTLPDGTKVYIDAETGQATDDVEAIKKRIYGIKDKDVNVRYHADTREPDNYNPPVKYGKVIYQSQAGTRQRG